MFELSTFLNSVTALFIIIDPIGAAIVFHALAGNQAERLKQKMALKAVMIAFFLLISFGLYGEPLLSSLGISIEALRISGGLLLFYTAFNMITKTLDYIAPEQSDVSVFPMSIPMLAGPGSLTLVILLFSSSQGVSGTISVATAILSVLLMTLVLMILSTWVKRIIGVTGDEILRRFLGVLLAALAIQFISDGVSNI